MNVLMLYPRLPDETFWNASRASTRFMRRAGMIPPLGLLTIAAYLPEDFHVRLVDRNVTEDTPQDWDWADVVFLSLMLAQEGDADACVARARAHRTPVAIGGPFTHAKPEKAAAMADWVCVGEAESIMPALVEDIRAGRRGRRYDGGNRTDMSEALVPRFELVSTQDYITMAIQFSRGCPFRCEFCDIIEIYGRVARTKTSAQVLAELTALDRLGFRGYVFLVDDNFIGNKRQARELLLDLARWNAEHHDPFKYYTEASLNLADDRALLEAMAGARMLRVFIGIETPDRDLLKGTLKMQNVPGDPLAKLRTIREHGIHIMAGFIVGFDDEAPAIFDVQRAFIQESGIGFAMLGLLEALPHTQLSRRLEQEDRLLTGLPAAGSTTASGLNFIPRGSMTKREYLNRYRQLIGDLYSADAFFDRILRNATALRPRARGAELLRLSRGDLVTVWRLVFAMGVRVKGGRRRFWRALAAVLWRNAGALEAFAWDCFGFFYLRQHVAFVQAGLSTYLATPHPNDVLDEVVPPASCRGSAT